MTIGLPPIDVLRYWLVAVRYEEALAARPRTRRVDAAKRTIELRNPSAERDYIKLSEADVVELLDPACPEIERPLNAEAAELFETRLARWYRYGEGDTDAPEILAAYPAVHLRRNVLSGVVRFEASMTFVTEEGKRFTVPSRVARRRGKLPPPPVRMRIRRLAPEEGPPLFADARLLSYELGVLPEEIDSLFAKWQRLAEAEAPPVQYLKVVAAVLGDEGEAPVDTAEAVQRLGSAAARRAEAVGTGARGYPVGLLTDAGPSWATVHLQRELEGLVRERLPLKESGALFGYLSGTPLLDAASPLLGLMPEKGVTDSQRAAAERFLGSTLTAVQGPPGTGKTTLIQHLAAHRVVSRMLEFVETGRMPGDITVIASTNNRAVDNAVDPLAAPSDETRFPWALRAGNRRVCETRFVGELKAAAASIGAFEGDEAERSARLDRETKRFKKLVAPLLEMLTPRLERARALAEKRRLEEEIDGLTRRIRAAGWETALGRLPNGTAVNAALEALERLDGDFYILSAHCEGRASGRRVRKVTRHYEETTSRLVAKCEKALKRLGREEILFTVPDTEGLAPADVLGAWEDAAEDGIDETTAALDELKDLRSRIETAAVLQDLKTAQAEIVVPDAAKVDEARADALRRAAVQAAEAVRIAHIAVHATSYLGALSAAIDRLENAASLRRIKPEIRQRLQELFPVWGCTLLSLGNVFEEAAGCIDAVIVDEAGQCHPAYGVSALLRGRRAMILGDVHQLTPVFGLTEVEERSLLRGVSGKGEPGEGAETIRAHDRSVASMQLLAEAAVREPLRLTDHFRCQSEIIALSERLCHYGLTVRTRPHARGDTVPFLSAPVLFMHVDGAEERDGGSRRNPAEAEQLCGLVDALLASGVFPEEIAVVTPYRSQLLLLKRFLSSRGLPIELSAELLETELSGGTQPQGIAVGTVHRFQGGERSVVLFSTVITHSRPTDMLNHRVNLINVAVSRAMDHLVVLGHRPTLSVGRLTRHLVGETVPPLSTEALRKSFRLRG